MVDALDAFGATLLAWHEHTRRELPWRRTREPWPILVAEVMLAQTQASRVARVFPGFLARFPDPTVLAMGETTELLAAWSGLGYNRRALRLRELARVLVEAHGGKVPRDRALLETLPGIGPAIAAAVAAQAFDEPVLPLDVNVRRLLRRALLPTGDDHALAEVAHRLASATEPWEMVQASFDFGALVCRATPRCDACPWRSRCAWDHAGPDPAPPRRHQGPFAGSHRQLRGRIVAHIAKGEKRPEAILAALGADPTRFWRTWRELVAEGFVEPGPSVPGPPHASATHEGDRGSPDGAST